MRAKALSGGGITAGAPRMDRLGETETQEREQSPRVEGRDGTQPWGSGDRPSFITRGRADGVDRSAAGL